MSDNEITREQNHINRIAIFKKRAKKFFATYENSSGGEDCLEVCLIRDGCRAVSQAEETINRQKAEIERLKKRDETAEKIIREQADTILRLKDENSRLSKKCENSVVALIAAKAEAVKEFAERLKGSLDDFYYTEEDALLETNDLIDDLVKEMVGEG